MSNMYSFNDKDIIDFMNNLEHDCGGLDKDLCEKCQTNPAIEPHTCPYLEDIHDDDKTLCTCCPECEQECAWDI